MLGRLGKDVFIYGVSSSISKFIGIFLLPIYTAYFTKEQYGSLDLISTVISFIAILGMLQLESAITRYYYEVKGLRRKQFLSTAFWTMTSLSIFLVITIFLLSNTISNLLFENLQYANIIKVASINILLFNTFGFLTVIIRFKKKPIIYSIIVLSQFISTAIVSVILIIYYQYGIMAFFIGQISGLFIGSLIMLIYLRTNIIIYFNFNILKEFLAYSIPLVPAVAGNWLNSYVNRFVMLGYLTVAEIGIYAVALKIASIFKLLDNAFRMAWGPFIWEQVKKNDYKLLLRKISIAVSITLALFAILFALFAEESILILSSKEYTEASDIIKILVLSFVFPIITQVIGIGTAITKKTIYNIISFFIGVSVNILLLFILVPKWGLIGVPISLLTSNITILIMMWYFSERLDKIGFNIKTISLITLSLILLTGIVTFLTIPLIFKFIILLLLLLLLIVFFNTLKTHFNNIFRI